MSSDDYTFCSKCHKKVWIGNTELIEGSKQRICIFCIAKELRDERERDKEINLNLLIQDLPLINKVR